MDDELLKSMREQLRFHQRRCAMLEKMIVDYETELGHAPRESYMVHPILNKSEQKPVRRIRRKNFVEELAELEKSGAIEKWFTVEDVCKALQETGSTQTSQNSVISSTLQRFINKKLVVSVRLKGVSKKALYSIHPELLTQNTQLNRIEPKPESIPMKYRDEYLKGIDSIEVRGY